jgi:hypothetical protein
MQLRTSDLSNTLDHLEASGQYSVFPFGYQMPADLGSDDYHVA